MEYPGDSDMCSNTSGATMWLSMYLMLLMGHSIFKKSVPREVRERVDITKEALTAFNLDTKQGVQALMVGFTALMSIPLLSSVGVPSKPNGINFICGALGGMMLAAAVMLEMIFLIREARENPAESKGGLETFNLGGSRRVSWCKDDASPALAISSLV